MDELVYIYLILVEIFYLILAQDISPQSNFSLIGVVFGIMSAIVVTFWVVKFFVALFKGFKNAKWRQDDHLFEVGFKSGIKPSIVFDVTMLVIAVVLLLGSLFIPGNGLFWPTLVLAAIGGLLIHKRFKRN
ncbi:hypothetical protein [Weissella confusa]|uniref:hypothetical protein n=1 Tax=Weissella confusa TaxID=1583 RepID=UPI0022E8371C|nr:hypothetical protein [Weissella confusa]